jgi:hypothetical protein
MANVHVDDVAVEHDREEVRSKQLTSAGGFVEAIAGLAAVVLSILGLSGTLPVEFAAVGLIVVAAALLIEGNAIAARVYRTQLRQGAVDRELPEIAGGLGAESLTAVAGLVLGVLALVGTDPFTLMPVAAIVLGVGMMLGSVAARRMSSVGLAGPGTPDVAGLVAREAVRVASSAHVLVGLAVVILGIVGIVAASPLTVTLVCVLCLGATVLLSGAAIGARLVDTLRAT